MRFGETQHCESEESCIVSSMLLFLLCCTKNPPKRFEYFSPLTNGKLIIGINVLSGMETILKKINVLFIIYICLGKYSFSHDSFYTFNFLLNL